MNRDGKSGRWTLTLVIRRTCYAFGQAILRWAKRAGKVCCMESSVMMRNLDKMSGLLE